MQAEGALGPCIRPRRMRLRPRRVRFDFALAPGVFTTTSLYPSALTADRRVAHTKFSLTLVESFH